MSEIITGLLVTGTWQVIFTSLFFFGLFFFLLSIFGAFGDDDADLDGDGMDLDGDGIDLEGDGIDLDGDGFSDFDGSELDLDVDFEAEMDSGFDIEADVDNDLEFSGDAFDHLGIDSFDAEFDRDDVQVFESKYKMGEVATFSMFFGMVGWYYASQLTDLLLGLALLIGFIAMKGVSTIISKYTKTVVVPIKIIRRGDIAQVRYAVTPEKAGLVLIPRRDGVISTEMAKGAFSHDNFGKGEKGYVWGKEDGFYLITKGIQGQPDLNDAEKSPPSKKKAMDQ